MKGKIEVQIILIVVLILFWIGQAIGQDYAKIMTSIAQDIENLGDSYPQLDSFSVKENLHVDELSIVYAYHTHEPARTGGWSSGVPSPDDDGISLFIDFHDTASTAQIHTQPMTIVPCCFGDKRISFLLLEGKDTKSVNVPIWKILRKHGVKECDK